MLKTTAGLPPGTPRPPFHLGLRGLCLLAGLAFCGPLGAAPDPGPESIQQEDGSFLLQAQGQPLCSVLNRFIRPGGPPLNCPPSLAAVRITAEVQGPDRLSVLHRVLNEYNLIGIWGDTGHLESIIFVGLGTARFEPGPEPSPAPSPTQTALQKLQLTAVQLDRLRTLSITRPLPDYIWNSEKFQPLFLMAGLESQEDWLDIKNAIKVKKLIGKMLRTLKRRR